MIRMTEGKVTYLYLQIKCVRMILVRPLLVAGGNQISRRQMILHKYDLVMVSLHKYDLHGMVMV